MVQILLSEAEGAVTSRYQGEFEPQPLVSAQAIWEMRRAMLVGLAKAGRWREAVDELRAMYSYDNGKQSSPDLGSGGGYAAGDGSSASVFNTIGRETQLGSLSRLNHNDDNDDGGGSGYDTLRHVEHGVDGSLHFPDAASSHPEGAVDRAETVRRCSDAVDGAVAALKHADAFKNDDLVRRGLCDPEAFFGDTVAAEGAGRRETAEGPEGCRHDFDPWDWQVRGKEN